ncbi:sporulation protein [Streptomyces sp. CA-249302]|uniref:sporulation protein n=1 Tax=Streptomyces sp. CA-249302 TaxID=3240058 RepID=UPI003D93004A
MGFKRLFGAGDPGGAVEVDTQILGPGQPGGELRGEILLRGAGRDTYVDHVYLRIQVRCTGHDGGDETYEVETCCADPERFTLHKGREQRLTFARRLSWETPVSELGGRALGVVLSVKSELHLDDSGQGADVDDDLLHVSALPLHEAVLDAFAEEGYLCDSAFVVEGDLPDAEQHLGVHQTFLLTGHGPGQGRPEQLEVTFQTNAVGAMVHVRRAAPHERYWDDKPATRRFPAAHHEVGQVDWRPRVRKVLDELVLIESL